MIRNWRVWLVVFAVILLTFLMFGCGRVRVPEPRICATNDANPIRVADAECTTGRQDRVWLVGNDTLGPDDYTEIGEPVDDEYLGPDDGGVEHKSHTKKNRPTKAAKPTKR